MRDGTGRVQRVLLMGGTSEIGLAIVRAMGLAPGAEVVLAAREGAPLAAAALTLPDELVISSDTFDARDPETGRRAVRRAFGAADVDLVVPAFGVLGDQGAFEQGSADVAELLTVNVTSQAVVLFETARLMAAQGHGTLVVLSSIAGVRARRANFAYGSSKAALDALGSGLADAVAGTAVQVVVIRPGFVIGRMTRGLRPAPLACRPEDVGVAVARAIRTGRDEVWVPRSLRILAAAMRLTPRRVWRRLPR